MADNLFIITAFKSLCASYVGRYAMYTYLFICFVIMTCQLLKSAVYDSHIAGCSIRIDTPGSIKMMLPGADLIHTILLDKVCPFTERSIQNHLDQARKHDNFFILGAYACDDLLDVAYVDGKSLLARLFLLQGSRKSIDPFKKMKIKRTEFFECTYINDRLEIRAIGDIAHAQCRGTLLHNITRYLLAKDGEFALKCNGLLAQKLQEYGRLSLLSDDSSLCAAQIAYQMGDLHRARKWYQLIDHENISASTARELSRGCLNVALAFGLDNVTYVTPLLQKIVDLNSSPELVAEAAGRLGEIYYRQKDYAKSLTFMQLSAENGSVKAMCNLGTYYRNHENIKDALKWHYAAADKGALPGMLNLFVDLAIESKEHGIGVDTLSDYADELVLVINKGYGSNEAEKYVLNVFPKQAPEGYKIALKMIKRYTTIPLLEKFA